MLRKTFIFTHDDPGIREIEFKDLRAGDVFYTEEENGGLTVDFNDGDFISVALTDAELDEHSPSINYYVQIARLYNGKEYL